MTRSTSLFGALLICLPLAGGLTGCGNKGPLFLPPPAVQQPEPAAPTPGAEAAPAAAPADSEAASDNVPDAGN